MRVAPGRGEALIAGVMFALTMVAGAVDAITYLGLGHVFAALATGNVLLLGFGVAGTAGTPLAAPAAALGAFTAGVLLADRVIVGRLREGRRWFVSMLGTEAALIAAAGACTIAADGAERLPTHGVGLLVPVLAVAMGWHSRIMDQARIPDMPTTVLQTALVKAIVDTLAFRPAVRAVPRLTRMRRVATVAGILLGGVGGALLLRLGAGPGLLAVAGFEAAVVALYSRAPRLRPAEGDAPAATG
ncbi:YoaK family protein [Kitasatospora sp. NPDC059408]|uniref:YoaK family protein n=1 Tax=Kitasatospora sp. NPDC059408 TaxID=3346823 RepID=UPI0036752C3C